MTHATFSLSANLPPTLIGWSPLVAVSNNIGGSKRTKNDIERISRENGVITLDWCANEETDFFYCFRESEKDVDAGRTPIVDASP